MRALVISFIGCPPVAVRVVHVYVHAHATIVTVDVRAQVVHVFVVRHASVLVARAKAVYL
jgi:hypothetical protein